MNQDFVKEQLIRIEEPIEHFDLIFTGKSSKKVDGFYRPDERKIYIHNKNMNTDNQIIYTAIHEYAHHLHVTSSNAPTSNRCHTKEFWNIFHTLLQKAETLGIYQNPLEIDEELNKLTKEIKENFLRQNGELMKSFGEKLVQAQNICRLRSISFADYADRVLGLGRNFAKNVIQVSVADIDPSIGFENMRTIASIPRGEKRNAAIEAIKEGHSPDQIKVAFAKEPNQAAKSLSIEDRLKAEKSRLAKTIDSLSKKLSDIEHRLAKYEERQPSTTTSTNEE